MAETLPFNDLAKYLQPAPVIRPPSSHPTIRHGRVQENLVLFWLYIINTGTIQVVYNLIKPKDKSETLWLCRDYNFVTTFLGNLHFCKMLLQLHQSLNLFLTVSKWNESRICHTWVLKNQSYLGKILDLFGLFQIFVSFAEGLSQLNIKHS